MAAQTRDIILNLEKLAAVAKLADLVRENNWSGISRVDITDTTTMQELLVTTFATADALAKLLIEKGLITQEEFSQKLAAERATYQKLLSHKPQ